MQWQVAGIYKAIVHMQLNRGQCMGIAFGLDKPWAIIQYCTDIGIIDLVSSQC